MKHVLENPSQVINAKKEEALPLLLSGLTPEGVPVRPMTTDADTVVFQRNTPDPAKVGSLAAWFQATRAISLTATLAPWLMTVSYGLTRGWAIDWTHTLLAAASIALFQIAINLLNDFEDHVRLIDLPGTFGGAGVIQAGHLSALQIRTAAYVCLAIGVLTGVPVLLKAPAISLTLGGLGVLGVLGYSSKPFELKYNGLGDLAVILLCGPALVVGFAWVTFLNFDGGVLLLGLSTGFAANVILHANNLQDIPADSLAKARTMASLIGFSVSRHYMAAIIFAAYAFLIVGAILGYFSPWVIGGTLPSLPLMIDILKSTYRANDPTSPALANLRFKGAKFNLTFGLGFLLAQSIIYWRSL